MQSHPHVHHWNIRTSFSIRKTAQIIVNIAHFLSESLVESGFVHPLSLLIVVAATSLNWWRVGVPKFMEIFINYQINQPWLVKFTQKSDILHPTYYDTFLLFYFEIWFDFPIDFHCPPPSELI